MQIQPRFLVQLQQTCNPNGKSNVYLQTKLKSIHWSATHQLQWSQHTIDGFNSIKLNIPAIRYQIHNTLLNEHYVKKSKTITCRTARYELQSTKTDTISTKWVRTLSGQTSWCSKICTSFAEEKILSVMEVYLQKTKMATGAMNRSDAAASYMTENIQIK